MIDSTSDEGETHIVVTMCDSTITVYHGDTDEILLKRKVEKGYWDRLWKILDGSGLE